MPKARNHWAYDLLMLAIVASIATVVFLAVPA